VKNYKVGKMLMEGPHKLYSSPNLIGIKKSRSMRLVDLVARMGEKGSEHKWERDY
jgi:hypothetical protein